MRLSGNGGFDGCQWDLGAIFKNSRGGHELLENNRIFKEFGGI